MTVKDIVSAHIKVLENDTSVSVCIYDEKDVVPTEHTVEDAITQYGGCKVISWYETPNLRKRGVSDICLEIEKNVS